VWSAVNQVTLGVLLASRVVGAALVVRADPPAPFRVLGYSGPGALLLLVATAAGTFLASVILRDHYRSHAG
jgi:hypothetical protein